MSKEVPKEVIEELFKNYKTVDEMQRVMKQLFKRGLEALLEGEMNSHVGYEKHTRDPGPSRPYRNGHSKKIALTDFAQTWDVKYPLISKTWKNKRELITPFFDYPDELRSVIYTTNSVESLNMQIRKVIKNKRVFPSEQAAYKLLFLIFEKLEQKWSQPVPNWSLIINHFAIQFEARLNSL